MEIQHYIHIYFFHYPIYVHNNKKPGGKAHCKQRKIQYFEKNIWNSMILFSSRSNEFLDHLATIRLYDERLSQYPPKIVILETALIFFQSVKRMFEKFERNSFSFSIFRLKNFTKRIINVLGHLMNNTHCDIYK